LDVVEFDDELWSVMRVSHTVTRDSWDIVVASERSTNYINGSSEFSFEYPADPTYSTQDVTYDGANFTSWLCEGGVQTVEAPSWHPVGLDWNDGTQLRAAMVPTISSFPGSSVSVQSAKLHIYAYGRTTDPRVVYGAHSTHIMMNKDNVGKFKLRRMTSAVNTWAGSSTAAGETTKSKVNSDGDEWLTADVTDIVQAWFDGETIHGIQLRSVNPAGNYRNARLDGSSGGNLPYLVVTYLISS
jgi:hypothetical protein